MDKHRIEFQERKMVRLDSCSCTFLIYEGEVLLEDIKVDDGVVVRVFVVPSEVLIEGEMYRVIQISPNAFGGCKDIEIVEIPSSVSVVCDGAFDGCDALKEIWLRSENTMFRKDLLMDKMKVFVGEDRKLFQQGLQGGEKKSLSNLKITSSIKCRDRSKKDYIIHDIMNNPTIRDIDSDNE